MNRQKELVIRWRESSLNTDRHFSLKDGSKPSRSYPICKSYWNCTWQFSHMLKRIK